MENKEMQVFTALRYSNAQDELREMIAISQLFYRECLKAHRREPSPSTFNECSYARSELVKLQNCAAEAKRLALADQMERAIVHMEMIMFGPLFEEAGPAPYQEF